MPTFKVKNDDIRVHIGLNRRFLDTFQRLKIPCRRIRAHYKQLSEFERDRIIELYEVGWANRKINRHMVRSDASVIKCWQEWVGSGKFQRHDGSD
ncbi:HTH_Tnp_Tc3_2 domain-containing protein [Trichonephila clavipes]|nr:HTH_Tnp_Tc3_2 domain-containing protein [Trichonephila clavipes]